MIKAAQFDDALYFLERFPLIALEDKDKTENSVRLSKGYQLMSNHKFAEAMRLFAQANLDLAQVIGMMPGLLPDDEDFRLSQESLFIQQTFEPAFMKPAAAELMWFLDQTNVPVHQKRLADTCRLKCLLVLGDTSRIVSFVSSASECDFDEAERALVKHDRISELVLFYRVSSKHRQALLLLASDLRTHLSDLTAYLNDLDDMALVYEFVALVSKYSPEDALTVLVKNSHIDVQRTLPFIETDIPGILVEYLEHLVSSHPNEAEFHNRLALAYASADSPKLLEFLQSSRAYDPNIVLSHLPDRCLSERVFLLGVLDRHEQALTLLVASSMFDAAETYCPEHEVERGIYLLLLRILLAHDLLNDALCLLARHPLQIPLMEALPLLPAEQIALSRVSRFLAGSFMNVTRNERDLQVKCALARGRHDAKHIELMSILNRRVVSSSSSVCYVCQKVIDSFCVSIYADGRVAHRTCV